VTSPTARSPKRRSSHSVRAGRADGESAPRSAVPWPADDGNGAMARVTLQTIADRLGVSRMTVSNAFSRPDQLSAPLRERILAEARELGYVGPDPAARALARGTTGAIGVLLTDTLPFAFTDEISVGFLGAVVDGLAPTGLALTLLTTQPSDSDVVPARDVAIDGALVYSCHLDSPARDWLLRRQLPLVFVDQGPMAGISSVNVDDRGGARAAAQHLVGLGHRRIGIVNTVVEGAAGIVDDPLAAARGHPPRQRILGWLDGLAGIVPTVVQTERGAPDDATTAAETLLAVEPRPTAVLCFSDVHALGIVRVARSLGLSVPGDISVVGFDDSRAARHSDPPLTTVRQDVDAKGRIAASLLTAAIEHARSGTTGRVRHHVLPTELVVRGSTAAAVSE
jgi:DNA-binding LacI/PurR family transcriptional regulator